MVCSQYYKEVCCDLFLQWTCRVVGWHRWNKRQDRALCIRFSLGSLIPTSTSSSFFEEDLDIGCFFEQVKVIVRNLFMVFGVEFDPPNPRHIILVIPFFAALTNSQECIVKKNTEILRSVAWSFGELITATEEKEAMCQRIFSLKAHCFSTFGDKLSIAQNKSLRSFQRVFWPLLVLWMRLQS